MTHLPTSFHTLSVLCAALAALALSACGGSDDGAAAVTPAPPPAAGTPPPASPPPAVSTTVTGAVVKGPVSGAQVCVYAVAANGRGSALGSCTTSDAAGNYSFAVPAGAGPLWVEATGGTYTDEATGAAATLPAGSPLRSLITANAGTVTTMLTPLTTLALNAAGASVGTGGTLDAAAFNAAAAQLLRSFNLPVTLNITGTVPAFGSGINSYGTALTAISQMVANGTTLAALLANVNPQSLAAAYATAAAPPAPPVAPPAPPPAAPPATPGSGAVALTFSAVTGVGPVDTSAFSSSNSTLLQAYEFGVGTVNESLTIVANASVAGSTDPNRSRRFVVQFRTVAPAVGATFTGPTGANSVGVQFYQFEDNLVPTPTGRLYNGAGGSVTVVARTASSITVRLNGLAMDPGALFRGLPSTGAFIANGEITAPIQR